jgi:N-acyl-D-aspartate/D-glutamate deacylase
MVHATVTLGSNLARLAQRSRAELGEREILFAPQTGGPAKALRLRDRGLLREGYCADIAIFDPDGFRDTATYAVIAPSICYLSGSPALRRSSKYFAVCSGELKRLRTLSVRSMVYVGSIRRTSSACARASVNRPNCT